MNIYTFFILDVTEFPLDETMLLIMAYWLSSAWIIAQVKVSPWKPLSESQQGHLWCWEKQTL